MVRRKRLLLLVTVLGVLLLLLSGWGIYQSMNQETPVIDIDESTITRSGLTFTPRLDENYIWMGGLHFTLERLVDGVWEPVDYIQPHIVAATRLFIHPGETITLDWSYFYGVLDDGTYRLVEEYGQHTGKMGPDGVPGEGYDGTPIAEFTYYGVFEITPDTPDTRIN